MKFMRAICRDRRAELARFHRRATARIVRSKRSDPIAAMLAALTEIWLADTRRTVRMRRGLPCRWLSSACSGHDMRQGGEGFAPLLGLCGAFRHRLTMLHGGKASPSRPVRRRSPSARLPSPFASPPRVSLLHGRRRLRYLTELMDEPPTRAPAVKLTVQRGARIPRRDGGRGSLGAVIAGREPSTGWPIAPFRRRVLSVGLAGARPRGLVRQGRAPSCPRRGGSPFRASTIRALLRTATSRPRSAGRG
jgi:hypothetical protein